MTTAPTDQNGDRHEKKIVASDKLVSGLGWIAAWVWTIVAGGGGLLLLLTRRPLPLTNGWFALFSGIAACPLTATLSQKCLGIRLSGRIRIAATILFLIAGRIALLVGSRVPWLSR
jgi:hypothetical protein